MTLRYYKLPAHPGEMSDGDLRHILGGLGDSEAIRSLLIAEAEAIRAGAERETRTLRNLWYSLIKPALSRAGLLHLKTSGGKDKRWDKNLSERLAELVRAGYTTYEEMQIVDGSRSRRLAARVVQQQAIVPLVGAHYPWLILFTEKDTIWGEVRALASLYGTSAISGSGEPSLACTENMVKSILDHQAYPPGNSIVLLELTDYDPWGYKIADAQEAQIQDILNTMDGSTVPLAVIRLGLRPDQLTDRDKDANAYEPPGGKMFDQWYAETGGVDGQPLGLELDALPMATVRDMFAEGIERFVDLSTRHDDLRDAYIDLIAYELLKPDLDVKLRAMRQAAVDSGLAREIVDTSIPGDLLRRAAHQGMDSLLPVADGWDLFGLRAELRDAMAATLNDGAAA